MLTYWIIYARLGIFSNWSVLEVFGFEYKSSATTKTTVTIPITVTITITPTITTATTATTTKTTREFGLVRKCSH